MQRAGIANSPNQPCAPSSLNRAGAGRLSIRALPARCAGLAAPIALTACRPSILDPQGPVGQAEKTILIDSLAIMLAIVIPTIVATFAFAWWFRASNKKARYLPDWAYSGRIELIVWGIPLLVIMLLGGVAWIGSHDLDPAQTAAVEQPAARGPGGLARLEVAVHLSGPARREREPACDPRRRSRSFPADLGQRHERILHPATRQHDLHDERDGDAAEPAGGRARGISRPVEPFQRRRFLRHAFRGRARCRPDEFGELDRARAQSRPDSRRRELRRACRKQSVAATTVHLPRRRPRAVSTDRHAEAAAWTWPASRAARAAVSPRTEH